MSNHLISLAYKRDLRTSMRKAVLVLMADKASDDGSGIWAAKQTMADELCCSKQTVIDTIKGFISEGLVSECGQRKSPNGYTIEYKLNIAAIEALALVKCHEGKGSTCWTGQPAGPVKQTDLTGQPAGPEPSLNPLPLVDANASTPPIIIEKRKDALEEFREAWNAIAADAGAVECRPMSPERRRKTQNFLKRYAVQDITEAIYALAKSDFLCGRGDKPYRANVTFLFNSEHMDRLAEGFYG